MTRAALAVVLVLGAIPASAHADAVDLPTVQCPAGSRAQPAHSPREGICAPETCTTDADCSAGTCEEMPLCVVPIQCGRGWDGGPFPDGGFPPPCSFDTTPAACGADGSCTSGSCQTRRVCVTPTAVEPVMRSGCGCHVGAASGEAGAWLLALGTLGILAARRARR
ncbi:MAG: MYXO-CTERM sorting domain-containing protein [Sandaracinus sp.]